MHLASTGLSLGGLVTPQIPPPTEFGDGVLRAALQNSQPHNIFVVSSLNMSSPRTFHDIP